VIAFEPDPTNVALLARNVAENRLGGHVRLHHAALADAPASACSSARPTISALTGSMA
jgi:FkbM family methyltransferase